MNQPSSPNNEGRPNSEMVTVRLPRESAEAYLFVTEFSDSVALEEGASCLRAALASSSGFTPSPMSSSSSETVTLQVQEPHEETLALLEAAQGIARLKGASSHVMADLAKALKEKGFRVVALAPAPVSLSEEDRQRLQAIADCLDQEEGER